MSLNASFIAKIDKAGPNGCWLWRGGKSSAGYGQVWLGKRPTRTHVLVHRHVFECLVGPIPAGMLICHTCDNPPCCNPDHLFVGDKRANARDMVRKQRDRPRRGALSPRAKLTDMQVVAMRFQRGEHGTSYEKLAQQFGVGHSVVQRICVGKVWRHLL